MAGKARIGLKAKIITIKSIKKAPNRLQTPANFSQSFLVTLGNTMAKTRKTIPNPIESIDVDAATKQVSFIHSDETPTLPPEKLVTT